MVNAVEESVPPQVFDQVVEGVVIAAPGQYVRLQNKSDAIANRPIEPHGERVAELVDVCGGGIDIKLRRVTTRKAKFGGWESANVNPCGHVTPYCIVCEAHR